MGLGDQNYEVGFETIGTVAQNYANFDYSGYFSANRTKFTCSNCYERSEQCHLRLAALHSQQRLVSEAWAER